MCLDEVIVNKEEAEAKHNSVSTEEVGIECDGAEAQLMAMPLSKTQTEFDSEFCLIKFSVTSYLLYCRVRVQPRPPYFLKISAFQISIHIHFP